MMFPINFVTTSNGKIYQNLGDTNNWLFTIYCIEKNRIIEKNYIFRYLKKYKIEKQILKRINKIFDNIAEIETSTITQIEYNLMKLAGVPSILSIYSVKQLYRKKLFKVERSCAKNNKRQEN